MNSPIMFGAAVTSQTKAHSKTFTTVTKRVPAVLRDVDPQLKLFMPCDAATWLLAESDYGDVVFGLRDLG